MIKKIILMFLILAILIFNIYSWANSNTPNDMEKSLIKLLIKYKSVSKGENANYIPELAKVNPNFFSIAVAKVNGEIISVGDDTVSFPIESISKPIAYMLALNDNSEKLINDKVGMNATGHKFNSILSLEENPTHIQNAYVNSGAIQITSFIKGKNSNDKWQRILNLVKKLSNNKACLGKKVYQSEMATNQRNRAIVELLNSYQMLASDPLDALDRYTKACSIMMTTRELALMGATFANHGVNPLTHKQVIQPKYIRHALSQMITNGLYENSGIWFLKVGIPAKSGVSGAILAIIPGKMAIAVFSPPLDKSGNSVRSQLVIEEFAKEWHLHLLEN